MVARLLRVACAALAIGASAGRAEAHQQGVSYSDIEVAGGRIRYDLSISNHDLRELDVEGDGVITSDEILAGYPALRRRFARSVDVEAGGRACVLDLKDFLVDPNQAIVFRLRGECDGHPLRVRVAVRSLLGADGYNFAKIRYQGRLEERVFGPTYAEAVLGDEERGASATLWRFFVLGVEHIATGYDHVLFLLALLMVGGGVRSLIAIVTAFTVAHSLTLALATLGIVDLPSRPVEAAIALSIAWVALENIVLDRPSGRWGITFAFGLVHGFGFASILQDMQLPSGTLATALVAFNVGVEAGQVIVVLLAYPVVAAIQRSPRRRAIVGVTSGVILAIGLFWFVERTFS
jgi:hypothetical protein